MKKKPPSFRPFRTIAVRSTGAALISTLLVTAFIVTLATIQFRYMRSATQNAASIKHSSIAWQYVYSVEAFAKLLLLRDLKSPNSRHDHLSEAWALTHSLPTWAEWDISFAIQDLNGRANINNLLSASETMNMEYAKLLKVIFENNHSDSGFVYKLADWMDSNSTPLPKGAEDTSYQTTKNNSYLTANQAFIDLSELLLLGLDTSSLQAISGSLVALPQASKININTASLPLLEALSNASTAYKIVQSREATGGFESVDDFKKDSSTAGASFPWGWIDVKSDFFILHCHATVGNIQLFTETMLYRNPTDETIVILNRKQVPFSRRSAP